VCERERARARERENDELPAFTTFDTLGRPLSESTTLVVLGGGGLFLMSDVLLQTLGQQLYEFTTFGTLGRQLSESITFDNPGTGPSLSVTHTHTHSHSLALILSLTHSLSFSLSLGGQLCGAHRAASGGGAVGNGSTVSRAAVCSHALDS